MRKCLDDIFLCCHCTRRLIFITYCYVWWQMYKQNFRFNPRDLHQQPLLSAKVTVCCAMSSLGIILFWRWPLQCRNSDFAEIRRNVGKLFYSTNWTLRRQRWDVFPAGRSNIPHCSSKHVSKSCDLPKWGYCRVLSFTGPHNVWLFLVGLSEKKSLPITFLEQLKTWKSGSDKKLFKSHWQC